MRATLNGEKNLENKIQFEKWKIWRPLRLNVNGRPFLCLSTHHHAHKLLIVDVALRVLLVLQQLFHLVVRELLTKRRQQVPQFGGGDEAAGVLVKVAQSLDKVVSSVHAARLGDGLVDGQEDLEGDALVGLQLVRALEHIRLGGVLAEGTQALAHLVQLDLSIAARVKQVEGLLELWKGDQRQRDVVRRCHVQMRYL